jgi:hypothetical protein
MANSRPILSDGPRRHGKLIGRCPPDRHTNKETTHGHTDTHTKRRSGQWGSPVKLVQKSKLLAEKTTPDRWGAGPDMKAPISADERKRAKLSWQPKILAKINKEGGPRATTTTTAASQEDTMSSNQRQSAPKTCYPLVAVVRIDVFDGDGGEFRWEDGSQSDGKRHALFQCRVCFGAFVFIFVFVSNLRGGGGGGAEQTQIFH